MTRKSSNLRKKVEVKVKMEVKIKMKYLIEEWIEGHICTMSS